MTTDSGPQPGSLGWLVTDFVRRVPGVVHAAAVSADGLLLAGSERLSRARADQLSAVASGLVSLTNGGARVFDAGDVSQTMVEMDRAFLFLRSISDGSCLAVLAAADCDVGLVSYEMVLLVDRVARQLTPKLRDNPRS